MADTIGDMRIINCTGTRQFVLAGRDVVELEQGSAPVALSVPVNHSRIDITVADGEQEVGASIGIGERAFAGLLSLPAQRDDVLWLVTRQQLGDYPHRTDFVAPGDYRYIDQDLITNSPEDPVLRMGDKYWVLASVVRAYGPVPPTATVEDFLAGEIFTTAGIDIADGVVAAHGLAGTETALETT